jgi:hypothetical protein
VADPIPQSEFERLAAKLRARAAEEDARRLDVVEGGGRRGRRPSRKAGGEDRPLLNFLEPVAISKPKKERFVALPAGLWKVGLRASERDVLEFLYSARDDDFVARRSYAAIARATGLSYNGVRWAVEQLMGREFEGRPLLSALPASPGECRRYQLAPIRLLSRKGKRSG